MRRYTLDDQGNPVREPDLIKWATWFENTSNRTVADETVGDAWVSTVFLGLDHSFVDDAKPLLWETMVFGGKLDEEQDRCSGTREDAKAMHARMVERVKRS